MSLTNIPEFNNKKLKIEQTFDHSLSKSQLKMPQKLYINKYGGASQASLVSHISTIMSRRSSTSNLQTQQFLYQDTSLGKLLVNPKLVEKLDLKRDMALTGNKIDTQETTKMKELELCAKMGFGIDVDYSRQLSNYQFANQQSKT